MSDSPSDDLLSQLEGSLGAAAGESPPPRALAMLGEAWQKACREGDEPRRARIACLLGLALDLAGHFELAVQVEESGLHALRATPGDRLARQLRHHLAGSLARWCQRQRDEGAPPGEWRAHAERAERLARDAIAACRAEGEDPGSACPLASLARALVVLGRSDEALARLDEAESLLPADVPGGHRVDLLAVRARARMQLDDKAGALALLEEALRASRDAPGVRGLEEVWWLLASAREATGDLRGALAAHHEHDRLREKRASAQAHREALGLADALETDAAWRRGRTET